MNVYELFGEDASGVVASRKQARDPRYSMSLSPDVRPGEINRQLKKYSLAEGAENLARLDAILIELCEGIIKHKRQDSDRYGLVAAAVVDPDHNVVYGINNLQSNGKRVHAERAALANYKSKHGDIPEGSIIVTTLSPCTEPMADREGISCSELIDTTVIRRVYAGYRDPSQDHLAHDDFDVVVTNNNKIQELCKGFADCFLTEPVTEDTDVNSVAQEFVKFAADRLKFQQLPHIDFVDHVTGAEHPTFGMYDSNTDTISIGTSDRHVMDIMRTLAHELVHHKQRETKPQSQLDGGTASQDENQANSVAGTLMREFADQHPEYFGGEQINELGNAPAEYKPNRQRKRSLFHATVDGQWVDVFFDRSEFNGTLHITFAVNGDYDAPSQPTSASKSTVRILSTVLNIVKKQLPEYMAKARPPAVSFTAKGDNRTSLYRKYFVPVIQNILGPKWQHEEYPSMGMTVFHWRPVKKSDVTEAFDQPYDIQWTKQNGDWHATADLDDGSELVVLFMSQGDNQWMVEFERDENMEITGEGDAPRVFATVLTAMQQFIAKRKPAMLNFSAEKEDDPTGSRARLYDRMIQRYITGTGYDLTRKDVPGGATYTLTKQAQGVAENFADGRNPQDKGDSKRYHVPTKASVSTLRKVAKQGGRKGQLAHWMANMKAGRAKARKR